jgi:hypothetical protein
VWFLVTVLVWLLEATVWFALVALMVRPWGIRLPILWWHTPESGTAALPALGRWQYVIVEGVLKWGLGSWLLLSSANYIACHFEYHSASCETVGVLCFSLAGSMFMGLLVGLGWWARRQRDIRRLSVGP